MKRIDKIRLLRSIDAGSISFNELNPREYKIEVCTTTGNGTYYLNNKVIDAETYLKEIQKLDTDDQITILIDGREL